MSQMSPVMEKLDQLPAAEKYAMNFFHCVIGDNIDWYGNLHELREKGLLQALLLTDGVSVRVTCYGEETPLETLIELAGDCRMFLAHHERGIDATDLVFRADEAPCTLSLQECLRQARMNLKMENASEYHSMVSRLSDFLKKEVPEYSDWPKGSFAEQIIDHVLNHRPIVYDQLKH